MLRADFWQVIFRVLACLQSLLSAKHNVQLRQMGKVLDLQVFSQKANNWTNRNWPNDGAR